MTVILGLDAAWTATVPFDNRRVADDVVSREFGARHCGAHSPTKERSGHQGAAFSKAFAAVGYAVGTTATAVQSYPRLLLDVRCVRSGYR